MSHEFYDFGQLKEGARKMVDLISQLYPSAGSQDLVSPQISPGFLRNNLPEQPPEQGCQLDDLLSQTKKMIYPGIVQWQSPRFFGYFPSTIAVTNVFAEMFATTFHSPAFNYSVSPSHTQLEIVMMDWTVKAVGLPDKFLFANKGGSIINTSTTESIFVTVHAAKRKKMDEINAYQNRSKILDLVGYFGEFSYIGNQRGLKLKQIFHTRAIPTIYSEEHQNLVIDTQKFEEIVEQDVKEGLIPFWYGGSYGTTFSVADDLNEEVIRICKKFGMWINIDAAYLGSSWICQEERPQKMHLMQQVDSVTINFSKSMFLGNGGSILCISDRAQLNHSMESNLNFSFYKNEFTGNKDTIDFKDWTIGFNRRFNSLKFFYLYKFYGLNVLRDFVRNTILKRQQAEEILIKSGIFKLFSIPRYGLICFQLCNKAGEKDNSLTKILGQKIRNIPQGYMTPGHYQQYCILRLALGNPSATTQIINQYIVKIIEIGHIVIQSYNDSQ